MTKEELARKKGEKYKKEEQNPSEALLTTVLDKPEEAKKEESKTTKSAARPKTSNAKKETAKATNSGKNSKPVTVKAKDEEKAGNKDVVVEEKPEVKTAGTVSQEALSDTKEQKKPGRPKEKKEEDKKMTLAIPLSLYEEMEKGAIPKNKNNATAYILNLIRKDLEENKETYMEVWKAMK